MKTRDEISKEIKPCPVWSNPLSSIIADEQFAKMKPEHALLYTLLLLHAGDDLRNLAEDRSNLYFPADPIELWWAIAYKMPHLKTEMDAAIKAWEEAGFIDVIEGVIQLEKHRPYATEQDRIMGSSSTNNRRFRELAAERENEQRRLQERS
jgi:hypothetical protein